MKSVLTEPQLRIQRESAASEPLSLRRIVPLDGLRGLAILMVLVVHFYQGDVIRGEYPTLTKVISRMATAGGYGVELFFVLSGFLITGILLDTKHLPSCLKIFYARRTLRIFPLYFLVLTILFLILPHLVTFDAAANAMADRQGWLWTYLMNLPWVPYIWDDSNVFWVGHLWSLCVEEHFYLLWPLAVVFLSPRHLLVVAVAFIGLAIGVRTLSANQDFVMLRWTTVTKIDGLLVGSILAVMIRHRRWTELLPSGRTAVVLALISSGLFGALMFVPKTVRIPMLPFLSETLITVLFGFILLAVWQARPGSVLYRIFGARWLVAFGKYSYGIYLLHGVLRPSLAGAFDSWRLQQQGLPPLMLFFGYYLVCIAISFLIAYGSFHLIEEKFLRLKRHFDYR